MSEPVSALSALEPAPAYIGIADLGVLGQVLVRADLSDPAIAQAISEAAGLAVPNTLGATVDDEKRLIWMAPDETLLVLPAGNQGAAIDALRKSLSAAHHMVLDVSDARAIMRLTGAHVGEVLAKGVPLDTTDHGFPIGTARRTHLAGLAVGIWRIDSEMWEIMCFRSFAHHLWAWLHKAAAPGSEVG